MSPLSASEIRRRAFRATLAVENVTMPKWAKKHGVSYTHLQLFLHNKRPSRPLERTIDQYIATTFVPFCRTVLTKAEPTAAA